MLSCFFSLAAQMPVNPMIRTAGNKTAVDAGNLALPRSSEPLYFGELSGFRLLQDCV